MPTYSDLILSHSPSAYWRLNEPSGTAAADSVGTAHGTISGGVTLNQPGALASGEPAMVFNGTTGKIVTAVGAALLTPFTVELWVRLNSNVANQVAFCNTFGAGDNLVVLLGGGAIYVYTGTQGSPSVLLPFDSAWHHVVFVCAGGVAGKIYADGVLGPPNDVNPITFTAGVAKAFEFGHDPNWAYFTGSLDEVAIYARALSATEIRDHYLTGRGVTAGSYGERVLTDGASAYWRLDEASGLTARDSVGAADGTISGGVTLGQAGALVAAGNKAFSFNGTTGKVLTAASVPVPLVATIEGWGKTVSVGVMPLFSTRGTGGTGNVVFAGLEGGHAYFYSVAEVRGTRTTLSDGLWHHFAFVLDGTTVAIYIDGALDATGAQARITPSAGPARIAVDEPNAAWWAGALDEVALYPLALTAPQIAQHYALGTTSLRVSPIPWPVFALADEDIMPQSYNNWRPVTPSDSADLPELTDAIWIGGAGDVAAVLQNNAMPVVLAAVPAGSWLPLAARRVNATGTTATAIVALFAT